MNLVGGWVFTGLVMLGFPDLRHAAVEVATHYAELGHQPEVVRRRRSSPAW